jgi:lipopolysaccharide transport system permease protein
MVDFAVALVMLLAMMIWTGVHPGVYLLLTPVPILLLVMLSLGIGLMTAALTVSYRDVQYILPVAMQILLYASPIAYSVSAVPAHWQWMFRLNPLVAPMEAFRAGLLNTALPPSLMLTYSAAVCAAVFVAGLFTFKAMERKFADVI